MYDFINREKGQLDFNIRVLDLTRNKRIPLLERFKFLSISGSNLDEFIMVRFSYLKNRAEKEAEGTDISGLTAKEEERKILKEIKQLRTFQDICMSILKNELKGNNILISKYSDLLDDEMKEANKLFDNKVISRLKPISISNSRAISNIGSKDLNILVELQNDDKVTQLCTIALDQLPRLIKIKSQRGSLYVPIEELIYPHLHKLFYRRKIMYRGIFKLVRSANNELSEVEDGYIVEKMKAVLKQRRETNAVILEVDNTMDNKLVKHLRKLYGVSKEYVLKQNFVNIASMKIEEDNPQLEYKKYEATKMKIHSDNYNIFDAIDANDIVLHHPYDSYDPVIQFLEHAADDKDVVMINQTLYRVSSKDSPIINALCRASKKGKNVLVMLEIKARFDEDQNIELIQKLQENGVKVVHGYEEFKTHCKTILIVRQSKKGDKYYTHIGTGNYSEKNAKMYTDISFFTSNEKVGRSIDALFNILSGWSDYRPLDRIKYSPFNLRETILNKIQEQVEVVENGGVGKVNIKVNAISDKEIVEAIYNASEKGVKFNIVCRSACSIRKINDNLNIKSIVGRFLEHSRIYEFGDIRQGGEIYISSADLLTRNLDRRFEILFPVKGSGKYKISSILNTFIEDEVNSYIMREDGSWKKPMGVIDSVKIFMKMSEKEQE